MNFNIKNCELINDEEKNVLKKHFNHDEWNSCMDYFSENGYINKIIEENVDMEEILYPNQISNDYLHEIITMDYGINILKKNDLERIKDLIFKGYKYFNTNNHTGEYNFFKNIAEVVDFLIQEKCYEELLKRYSGYLICKSQINLCEDLRKKYEVIRLTRCVLKKIKNET